MSNPMDGSDAVPRGVALTPKVIAEVKELHARIAELDSSTGGRGRKFRHERRMAREAEQDLLRVLGFESYGQFSTVVAGFASASDSAPAPAREPGATPRVEPPPPASLAVEAEQTEAELLNVLRSRTVDDEPLVEVEVEIEVEEAFDEANELRARVGALEAELGRAGNELQEMRAELGARGERRATADAAGGAAVVEAAAGLVQAIQELRSFGEMLREERREIEAIAARSRAEAQRILEDAREGAQHTRDAAEAEARATLDRARSAALELTRRAIVTADGLRSLAVEGASGWGGGDQHDPSPEGTALDE